MPLELIVLGANSAHPLIDRFSSSFVLRNGKRSFLIDAGEGCQIKLSQFKVKRSKISHIFISHLHGDHLYGLPGVITSYNLNHRPDRLTIWGPTGIRKFIDTILEVSEVKLCYELIVHEIGKDEFHQIEDLEEIEIFSFPLQHRIKTFGYLFREKHEFRNIIPERISQYKLTIEEIKAIKEGEDLKRDGAIIPNREMTYLKVSPKSFAYCSDTIYDEGLKELLKGVDLIYHEATYTDELKLQARARMHSTAREAAMIAAGSEAKSLLIGHFSSRYSDLSPLLKEARSVFLNTELATEGKTIII